MLKPADFEILKGKTLKDITISEDEIIFQVSDEEAYVMKHQQDCCESVIIDDICGNIKHLIGSPILKAEERSNSEDPSKDKCEESHTWTFYELATIEGSVTIRWYGCSNGYYSESVQIYRIWS